MKKLLSLLVVMSSWALYSASLDITVRDVLDLATYDNVLHESIILSDEKQVKTYTIKEWWSSLENCRECSIQLSIEVIPVKSELSHDCAYALSMVKELHFQNKLVSTLTKTRFMLAPGQEKVTDDINWKGNLLMVRQQNIFSMRP